MLSSVILILCAVVGLVAAPKWLSVIAPVSAGFAMFWTALLSLRAANRFHMSLVRCKATRVSVRRGGSTMGEGGTWWVGCLAGCADSRPHDCVDHGERSGMGHARLCILGRLKPMA